MSLEYISPYTVGAILTLESPNRQTFFPTYMTITFLASFYGMSFEMRSLDTIMV
jgi:hypothetical protein